jgi:hypothetical protein
METLVKRGLLQVKTEANKWVMSGDEEVLMPPDGYVVSFVPFHKRRLMVPHRFFQGLLHYYNIELQHLNPNGV